MKQGDFPPLFLHWKLSSWIQNGMRRFLILLVFVQPKNCTETVGIWIPNIVCYIRRGGTCIQELISFDLKTMSILFLWFWEKVCCICLLITIGVFQSHLWLNSNRLDNIFLVFKLLTLLSWKNAYLANNFGLTCSNICYGVNLPTLERAYTVSGKYHQKGSFES